MYPTIEDIRKIAAKGQYKRVPVCREVYADRYTPVEAMRTLRKASRHCYLLESASQTEGASDYWSHAGGPGSFLPEGREKTAGNGRSDTKR